MSVSLSLFAGAGGQFFDNNGVPLSGGLLYTYAAGTTTPQTTYTASAGNTANANPIVLDSAGRTPSEIWLTSTLTYKFLLKTSVGTQIASYDDIGGSFNSAFLAASSGSSLIGYIQGGSGSVATTVQTKLRESVSVKDFGAACDWNGTTGTNDSAAIQLAVNYCIANNVDLFVPSLCLLSSSVNIDRQVDGAAYDNYFTIHGGGFVVTTAIPMFSSTILYTVNPVSQLVQFNNVIFESNDTALNAYVLDGARFLRTQFEGCSFRKIKCLYATTYTQSIYFQNCNVRRVSGAFFFSAGSTCYDTKFSGCLIEAGVSAFKATAAVGCSFIGNTIEGQSGNALEFIGAQGLTVHGNYFEGNGVSLTMNSANPVYGASIKGNYFADDGYSIFWNICVGCVSNGNYSAGSLHNLTGNEQELEIHDFAVTNITNSPTAQVNPVLKNTANNIGSVNSGGANVTLANNTATTLFAVTTKGMYLLSIGLNTNDAANNAAFATIVMDGTSARIVSNNGASITLTLSGANVQATQTTGASQTGTYSFLRIV